MADLRAAHLYIYIYIYIYICICNAYYAFWIYIYIRVIAALRSSRSLHIWKLSSEEVLESSFDPLGLTVDPLGQVRGSYELLCKYVSQLSGKFVPVYQIPECVDKYACWCSTFTEIRS